MVNDSTNERAKEMQREYYRKYMKEWRKNNKDKIRKYQQDYWMRKAAKEIEAKKDGRS